MARSRETALSLADVWARPLVAEFVGTFVLIFAGAGAIIATGGQDLVAIALAHGLAIGVFVAAAGHISGGLYNPALVFGLLAARKIDPLKGAAYIAAQILGAVVAAAILRGIYPESMWQDVSLGVPLIGEGFSVGQAFVFELIMTAFLMFVVFGSAVDTRGPRAIAPLAIGLTISMGIFLGGAATGAAMNPARSFGPAAIANVWDDEWLYWLAPILGALIAAVLYAYVLLPQEQREQA